MGVVWPSPRFIDNANGTFTDNLTGLIWMKNAECFGGWGALAWSIALEKIVDLNDGTEDWCPDYVSGTFNDWRLPTINELESLIDYGRSNPSLPADALFLNFPGNYFYSSSTNGYSPSSRWGVLFFNGSMEDISMNTKVLLVRGGTQ